MAQFRKKIGTVAMRYLFEVTILSLSMELPYYVNVGVIFKKGMYIVISKNKKHIKVYMGKIN